MRKQKLEISKQILSLNFYRIKLMERTVYNWQKITNQSQIEKLEIVQGLRSDKMFSLLVKGFSSLLFNKEEMKRIRIQKKKYTFFMKNRVFRHWTQYVNQVQEHQIKSNYFQARWNFIHKNDILKKWKIQHLKMKANHVSK